MGRVRAACTTPQARAAILLEMVSRGNYLLLMFIWMTEQQCARFNSTQE
jgi:hypothetical protein